MAKDQRVLIRKVDDHFFLVPSLLIWEQIEPCWEYEFDECDPKLWSSFSTEERARKFASRCIDRHTKPTSIEVIDFEFDFNSFKEKS